MTFGVVGMVLLIGGLLMMLKEIITVSNWETTEREEINELRNTINSIKQEIEELKRESKH